MKYPKPVMKKRELMDMGISRRFLERVSTEKGQTLAWHTNPLCEHSPLMFDTAELEKKRLSEIRLVEQSRQRRVGVM